MVLNRNLSYTQAASKCQVLDDSILPCPTLTVFTEIIKYGFLIHI